MTGHETEKGRNPMASGHIHYFMVSGKRGAGSVLQSSQVLGSQAAVRAANLEQVASEKLNTFISEYIKGATMGIIKLSQLILYIAAQNADIRGQGQLEKKSSGT